MRIYIYIYIYAFEDCVFPTSLENTGTCMDTTSTVLHATFTQNSVHVHNLCSNHVATLQSAATDAIKMVKMCAEEMRVPC